MTTKLQALQKHYQQFFNWVSDEKIMSKNDVASLIKTHNVGVEKITKMVETFFVPYVKADKLEAYVELNLQQGSVFLEGFSNVYKQQNDMATAQTLARLAALKLTVAQKSQLCRYIKHAVKIIQM